MLYWTLDYKLQENKDDATKLHKAAQGCKFLVRVRALKLS